MTIGETRLGSSVGAGIRERMLAIRSIGMFADVDDEGARLLTEHARMSSFAAGARVAGLDGFVESVHVILEGSIVVEGGAHGRIEVGPGRPVGIIRLLANAPRSPPAIALFPTRTLEIPGTVMLAALEENFSLWRGALRMITSTLIDVRGALPPAGDGKIAPGIDGRPRTLVERAMEISSGGIFRDANVDAVFDVARILREIHVPAGHVFWHRTEPAHRAVRVVSGIVRCTDESGRSVVTGPEYMLGTIAAAAQRSYGYEARAETDVSGYEVFFEDWLVVLEAHPELAMRLLGALASMLADAMAFDRQSGEPDARNSGGDAPPMIPAPPRRHA